MSDDNDLPKPLNFELPMPTTWKDFRPDKDIYYLSEDEPRPSFYFDDEKFRKRFRGPPCRMWTAKNWPQRYLKRLVPSLGGTNSLGGI